MFVVKYFGVLARKTPKSEVRAPTLVLCPHQQLLKADVFVAATPYMGCSKYTGWTHVTDVYAAALVRNGDQE